MPLVDCCANTRLASWNWVSSGQFLSRKRGGATAYWNTDAALSTLIVRESGHLELAWQWWLGWMDHTLIDAEQTFLGIWFPLPFFLYLSSRSACHSWTRHHWVASLRSFVYCSWISRARLVFSRNRGRVVAAYGHFGALLCKSEWNGFVMGIVWVDIAWYCRRHLLYQNPEITYSYILY